MSNGRHPGDKNEYISKSELTNDLVRQARRQQRDLSWIRSKLEKAEESGFTNDSKEDTYEASRKLYDDPYHGIVRT